MKTTDMTRLLPRIIKVSEKPNYDDKANSDRKNDFPCLWLAQVVWLVWHAWDQVKSI